MKKYCAYFILFCSTLLSSCTHETVVGLDSEATDRVENAIQEYYTTLSDYKYGWIAEVETNRGLYQFYMKFTDDNMVTMYTDNLMYPEYNGIAQESTYNIRSLQRPTLSFDTYCYLSIINDPDDYISGGSGNQGLETDFEFEIDSYLNGTFRLKGRINRVDAFLRKATAYEAQAVTESEMMNSFNNLLNYNFGQYNYFTTDDGVDVSLTFAERSMELYYVDDEGKVKINNKYTLPRMDYSVDMYGEIEIDGEEFKGLEWDGEAYYACVGKKKYLVQGQDEAVIPLYKLVGKDKRYTEFVTLLSTLPNEYNYVLDQISFLENMFGVQELVMNFEREDEMIFTIPIPANNGGFIEAKVTYTLAYSEDRSRFVVTGMHFDDDKTGYGENLHHLLEEHLGASNSITHYWLNREFRMEWSDHVNEMYKMRLGSLTEIDNPEGLVAKFYGFPI